MSEELEDAAIAFLLRLDPGTQREVLRRYEEILQVELDTDSARLRRIAVALHQTTRTLGHPPSVREYKRLRDEHPERGWPDQRSITRWLGVRSWNDALVRIGLTAVLDGDNVEGAIGPAYSIDEVLQAVRDCAEDLRRVPTITDFLAWQRRPDVRERPGRRPASTWVFNRIFGGFRAARVAAGLVDGDETAAHPSELLLRTANYRLSTEQILQDIRDVAARTSGHLTATVYDRERRRIYLETKTTGRPRALAGVGSIYRHFGSWTRAVEAADVGAARSQSDASERPRTRLTDQQVLNALRDASKAVAPEARLTVATYVWWRDQHPEAQRLQLPSLATLHRRFGGFPAALAAAGLAAGAIRKRPPEFGRKLVVEALTAAAASLPDKRLTVMRYEA